MRAHHERAFRAYRHQEAAYYHSKAFEATNRRFDHEIHALAVIKTALVVRESGENRTHHALAALWRG